jgi:hypothetical protein
MRWTWLLFAGLGCGLVCLASCSRLRQPVEPTNLVSLEKIPAEWGNLVAVLHAPISRSDSRWDELWFENEDTGIITFVPVYRWKWGYDPDNVKTIDRSTVRVPVEGGAR